MASRILRVLILLRYVELLRSPRVLKPLTVYSKGWLLRIFRAFIVLRYLEILIRPQVLEALTV